MQQYKKIRKQEYQEKYLSGILNLLKENTEASKNMELISNFLSQELSKLTKDEISYMEESLKSDALMFDLYRKVKQKYRVISC